jgi:FkbM family methyltransferase
MYSFTKIEHIIENLCNVDKGYFVDIGAHDGISGSNSKYFEEKGWDGICIEPHPDVFKLLKKNRVCSLSNAAVWKEDTEVDFLAVSGYPEMLSGIVESYDPQHSARIDREIEQMGGSSRLVKIPAMRFDTLVDRTHIDFLSIDTEGSELEILKNIDFDKYNIRVICIENNFNDPIFVEFFLERGYTYHSYHLMCDQIFYKK